MSIATIFEKKLKNRLNGNNSLDDFDNSYNKNHSIKLKELSNEKAYELYQMKSKNNNIEIGIKSDEYERENTKIKQEGIIFIFYF